MSLQVQAHKIMSLPRTSRLLARTLNDAIALVGVRVRTFVRPEIVGDASLTDISQNMQVYILPNKCAL